MTTSWEELSEIAVQFAFGDSHIQPSEFYSWTYDHREMMMKALHTVSERAAESAKKAAKGK